VAISLNYEPSFGNWYPKEQNCVQVSAIEPARRLERLRVRGGAGLTTILEVLKRITWPGPKYPFRRNIPMVSAADVGMRIC
jgi:hypothetical protein